MTGRVVRFDELGGPEVLRIDQEEPLAPGEGELDLRIEAIGLNKSEALFRQGKYFQQPVLPSRIGYEASAVVERLGSRVTGFTVGQAVSVLPFLEMTSHGVYADRAVVPAAACAPRPDGMDATTAAALWMPAITAVVGLRHAASRPPGPDDVVLVTAAASSVGLAMIRMARRGLGCRTVIGALREASKASFVEEAGGLPLVARELGDLVRGIGNVSALPPSVILDAVAGAGLAALAEVAGPRGQILVYGALGGVEAQLSATGFIGKALTVHGFSIGDAAPGTLVFPDVIANVRQGVAEGWVSPQVDTVLPLDDVVEAHRKLDAGRQSGKIILTTE